MPRVRPRVPPRVPPRRDLGFGLGSNLLVLRRLGGRGRCVFGSLGLWRGGRDFDGLIRRRNGFGFGGWLGRSLNGHRHLRHFRCRRLDAHTARALTTLVAFDDGISDDACHERDRADRVVVARDDVVDLIRVGIGIGQTDDRDLQPARLGDRDRLALGVDDEERPRQFAHLAHAGEVLLELVLLGAKLDLLLLGQGRHSTVVLHRLELSETIDALAHRDEVGEHAAEPPLIHEGHAGTLGLSLDRLLCLLLSADEQHLATAASDRASERVGVLDLLQSALQIEDVDTVALGEDIGLHLRVPATCLVTEVDTRLEQGLHRNDRHSATSLIRFILRPRLPSWRDATVSGQRRHQRRGRRACVLRAVRV